MSNESRSSRGYPMPRSALVLCLALGTSTVRGASQAADADSGLEIAWSYDTKG